MDYADVSSKLYNVLVRPVAEIIDGKKTLCIIPTGRLSLIPFQVLSYKQNNQQRFLIEDFEIFYTSQLEVFYEKTILSDRLRDYLPSAILIKHSPIPKKK
ncbi:MAG: CHAT domain-containing protein [Chitinophagaceae bacterium]|nr:CHAT domain-containing protein [Chitinophagaceae bacterium]